MNQTTDRYVGDRVVVKTSHNVHFAGKVIDEMYVNNYKGLFIELDADSGFSIFCPLSCLSEITRIPLSEQA